MKEIVCNKNLFYINKIIEIGDAQILKLINIGKKKKNYKHLQSQCKNN